ncbi:zinc-ribbon domain containing protein [Candidatus Collierbacteria bacterium]|nr:zinc-ribbon domain containing protein [Candidatus Collierbacteria bacterium]
MNLPPDREIKCVDCQKLFTFRGYEQQFYREKKFSDPKRCIVCRKIKKQQRGARDEL